MARFRDVPKKYIAVGAVLMTAAAAVAAVPLSSTVASLADSEFGKSDFSAAPINWEIEASNDRHDWTSSGGPITLELDSSNLVPGKAVYAKYWLRVKGGSPPNQGKVSMSGGVKKSGTALATDFQMRVTVPSDDACTQSSISNGPFIVGNANTSDKYGDMSSAGNSPFAIPAPTSNRSVAGDDQLVCFEFSLPDDSNSDAVNGNSVTVEWTFDAEESTT